MHIRIVNEEDIDARLDAEIRRGLVLCFPSDADVFATTRAWHGSAPSFSAVLEEGGTVVAHLGVVDRIIRVGTQPGACGTGVSPVRAKDAANGPQSIRVAGLQNVCVLSEHRGRGLVDRVLDAAMAEARRRGFDDGLLFCVPELEKVYARCGWRTLPGVPVTRIDDTGREVGLPGRNIAMYYPLARESFPPGPIHLQGNDW